MVRSSHTKAVSSSKAFRMSSSGMRKYGASMRAISAGGLLSIVGSAYKDFAISLMASTLPLRSKIVPRGDWSFRSVSAWLSAISVSSPRWTTCRYTRRMLIKAQNTNSTNTHVPIRFRIFLYCLISLSSVMYYLQYGA